MLGLLSFFVGRLAATTKVDAVPVLSTAYPPQSAGHPTLARQQTLFFRPLLETLSPQLRAAVEEPFARV